MNVFSLVVLILKGTRKKHKKDKHYKLKKSRMYKLLTIQKHVLMLLLLLLIIMMWWNCGQKDFVVINIQQKKSENWKQEIFFLWHKTLKWMNIKRFNTKLDATTSNFNEWMSDWCVTKWWLVVGSFVRSTWKCN